MPVSEILRIPDIENGRKQTMKNYNICVLLVIKMFIVPLCPTLMYMDTSISFLKPSTYFSVSKCGNFRYSQIPNIENGR